MLIVLLLSNIPVRSTIYLLQPRVKSAALHDIGPPSAEMAPRLAKKNDWLADLTDLGDSAPTVLILFRASEVTTYILLVRINISFEYLSTMADVLFPVCHTKGSALQVLYCRIAYPIHGW